MLSFKNELDMETLPQPSHWKISAKKVVEFEIDFVHDLFALDRALLAEVCEVQNQPSKILIVIDSLVSQSHGAAIRSYLDHWKFNYDWFEQSGGEAIKAIDTVLQLCSAINSAGVLRRRGVVVGIGGGTIGDVVGLAAALYRRGMNYIRIPTTLMGQIDAAIGVKSAVHFEHGKNKLGAYHAPKHVFVDPTFLKENPQRHISNGVAEIIKLAMVKDRNLFETLETHADRLTPAYLSSTEEGAQRILRRSIHSMLEEQHDNLWETELSRAADFGHTFSPGLEMTEGANLLHGEAVAVDMALSTGLSLHRGLLSPDDAKRALGLIKRCGLPLSSPVFGVPEMMKSLVETTKHRDGMQRMPVADGIGGARFLNDIVREDVQAAFQIVQSFDAY